MSRSFLLISPFHKQILSRQGNILRHYWLLAGNWHQHFHLFTAIKDMSWWRIEPSHYYYRIQFICNSCYTHLIKSRAIFFSVTCSTTNGWQFGHMSDFFRIPYNRFLAKMFNIDTNGRVSLWKSALKLLNWKQNKLWKEEKKIDEFCHAGKRTRESFFSQLKMGAKLNTQTYICASRFLYISSFAQKQREIAIVTLIRIVAHRKKWNKNLIKMFE